MGWHGACLSRLCSYRVYQVWASLDDSDSGEWLLRRRILGLLTSKSAERDDGHEMADRRRKLIKVARCSGDTL